MVRFTPLILSYFFKTCSLFICPINVVFTFLITIVQLCIVSLSFFFCSRLIGVEEYLGWDSVIASRMQEIRRRSMMILQWSICPMFFSSLLLAHLFIRSCMNNIRAGIHGFFLHLQAAYTCSVSYFDCFWHVLLPHF